MFYFINDIFFFILVRGATAHGGGGTWRSIVRPFLRIYVLFRRFSVLYDLIIRFKCCFINKKLVHIGMFTDYQS